MQRDATMHKVADADRKPRLRTGVDLTRMQLSAEEGYLLSRIDGQTSVKDLTALTGFSSGQIALALAKLRTQGAILFDGDDPSSAPPPAEAAQPTDRVDPRAAVVLDPAALTEACDLSQEQRKRVLNLVASLGQLTHFQLLEIEPKATAGEVRKAYFKASKEFHPDKFFRKDLGSFGSRIEKIFKAMKVAYDVLSNDQTREAYQRSIAWAAPALAAAAAAAAPVSQEELSRQQEREAQRQKAAKLKRLQRNPLVERIKRARELYEAGLKSMEAGKWSEAENHLRIAVTYDPRRTEYQTTFSEALGMANRQRAQRLLREIEHIIEVDADEEAVMTRVERLSQVAADDASAMGRCADALRKGGFIRKAFDVAQDAVMVSHRSEAALRALAAAAEQAGKGTIAFKTVERLLELKPKDPEYKEWYKRVKRLA